MNLRPVKEMYSEFYFVNTVYIFILTSHCNARSDDGNVWTMRDVCFEDGMSV